MIKKHLKCTPLRPNLFLVLSTLVILIGGGLTLLWQIQQAPSSRAESGNIIGPPSLPAATVDAIFARLGSPMVGTGSVVEQASRQTNVDDAFALAVWWAETNDGAAGVGRADRNPGSVRGSVGYPAAFDGYTIYPSYSAGIYDWFNVLVNRYVSRGLTSVYTICYPYVGTAGASAWAVKVVNLMIRYHAEAPAPTPVVTPTRVPQIQGLSVEAGHVGQVTGVQVNHVQAIQMNTANTHDSLSTGQFALIGFGLLLAALLALLGVKTGQTLPAPARVALRQVEPVTPLPALFSNEFSPISEQRAQWEPSKLAPWQPPAPAFVPQPAFAAPAPAGSRLLTSYRDSHRRVVLVSQQGSGDVEQSASWAGMPRSPITEDLSSDTNSEHRTLEPAGQRGGGLLRRYAEASQSRAS